jgi:hypothetical protein
MKAFKIMAKKSVAFLTVLALIIQIGQIDIKVVAAESNVQSISVTTSKTQLIENVDGYTDTITDELGNETDQFFYDVDYLPFSITVNYKDGTTKTYDNQYDLYNGTGYFLENNSYDLQSATPWGLGVHTVEATFMGATTTFDVEIIESPVQSISVMTSKPQLIENADGFMGTVTDELGNETDRFIYSVENPMQTVFTLTINYKDGTTKVYDDRFDLYEETGYFLENNSYDLQDQTPWGLGVHTVEATFMGVSTTFDVEVIETPVSSIQVSKLNPKLFEKIDGSYTTKFDELGIEIEYFEYYLDSFDFSVTVNYKDETSKTFVGYQLIKYLYETGYSLEFNSDELQEETPWELGTHTVEATFMGAKATFDVEVVETPVQSISVTSSNIKLIENVDGNIETIYDELGNETEQFFYDVDLLPLAVTVKYKDGTTKTFEDQLTLSQETGYSLYNNGYDLQDENPWGLGTHTVEATFMGVPTTFNVLVVENPVQSIEVMNFAKTSFIKDEIPNVYDLTLKVKYTNGTEKIFNKDSFDTDSSYGYLGINKYQATVELDQITNEIVVNYMNKEDRFSVSVQEQKSINSIEILNQNTLTPENIDLRINYVDETQEEINLSAIDYVYSEMPNAILEQDQSMPSQPVVFSTSKGIFVGYLDQKYTDDVLTEFTITIFDKTATVTSAPLIPTYNLLSQIAFSLGFTTDEGGKFCFNGELTAENINKIVFVEALKNIQDLALSEDLDINQDGSVLISETALKEIISKDFVLNGEIDLAESENFDAVSRKFRLADFEMGGATTSTIRIEQVDDGYLARINFGGSQTLKPLLIKLNLENKIIYVKENAEEIKPTETTLLDKNDTTIVLNEVENHEYSMDGVNWQASGLFTGLTAGEKYTFYQRTVETAEKSAGAISEAIDVYATPCFYGDLDGNREINSDDILRILNNMLKGVSLTAEQRLAADVKKDGDINSDDILLLLNKMLKGTDIVVQSQIR